MKLQRDVPVLRKAGFGVAAISYDGPAVLKDFASRKGITFPLLADHESIVIRQYGVADRRYRKGTQLDVDNETVYVNSLGYVPVDGLAYPSVFVIGPERNILWRFVSETSEFRLSAAAILERSVGIEPAVASPPISGKHVSVSVAASDSQAGLGTRMVLSVDVKMDPGVHVYAPQAAKEYRGLSWDMGDSKNCWAAAEPVYPPPLWKTFEFDAAKLPVYENAVHIAREMIIKPAINPKEPSLFKAFRSVCLDDAQQLRIHATLRLQACSDRECFPPQSIPLEWKIRFEPPDLERAPVDLRREFEQ